MEVTKEFFEKLDAFVDQYGGKYYVIMFLKVVFYTNIPNTYN